MIIFPKKFLTLETERLALNEISMNDIDFLFEIRNNDENNKFISRKKSSSEEVKQFIVDRISDFKEKRGLIWMIYNKNAKKNIGSICYWNFNFETKTAEIGYELTPDFQGKGFMQEALSKVIDFGFNKLNLQTIEAFTDQNNKASINVLSNYKFVQDIEFESNYEENILMFRLTNTNYNFK